ncbi:hypothetical protein BE221DRAFT_188145 [Ostreococcus tauri]|uniref:Sulfotransferase n=1 Tax=Ostreococcus tauri TaxID=70448 RepID=A0A1Y5I5D4_OSTTA|nr:hypothetical protein BE221DRAFT_188145 [Ostreococcus tauri]
MPVFLHVPKTGGTSIESALGWHGIAAGMCHLKHLGGYRAPRPYELRGTLKDAGWEPWHTPPANFVQDSWMIVRNPYSRAASEFVYAAMTRKAQDATFHKLTPGYRNTNCVSFQAAVQDMLGPMAENGLLKCYREVDYTVQGMNACDTKNQGTGLSSHHVPQSVMGSCAQRVFSYEKCLSNEEGQCPDPRTGAMQDNILKFVHDRYSKDVNFDEKIMSWNPAVPHPDLEACWEDFDPVVLKAFNAIYAADFKKFGYSMIQPKPNAVDGNSTFEEAAHETFKPSHASLGELEKRLTKDDYIVSLAGPRCPF